MRQRVLPALGGAFRAAGYRDFNGATVYLFEAKSPSSTTGASRDRSRTTDR
jgi:hypothetical protein